MVQHLTDRVSVESLTKLKPEDASTYPSGYGELKSPSTRSSAKTAACVRPMAPCPLTAGRTWAC